MKNSAKTNQSNSKTTKNTNFTKSTHITMQGMMSVDGEVQTVRFDATERVAGEVRPFRTAGTAQMLSDGTFEYITKKRKRYPSKQIIKLPHGTLSETHDGAYMLILRIPFNENCNAAMTLVNEASMAGRAIMNYEL